jgi:hypothetical protein
VKDKSVIDLMNAYLALEGLLESRILSDQTKLKLSEAMELLDKESMTLMNEVASQDDTHKTADNAA